MQENKSQPLKNYLTIKNWLKNKIRIKVPGPFYWSIGSRKTFRIRIINKYIRTRSALKIITDHYLGNYFICSGFKPPPHINCHPPTLTVVHHHSGLLLIVFVKRPVFDNCLICLYCMVNKTVLLNIFCCQN